jgi:hypothetical protein
MGFYIRKSKNFGPFRLNFSKSGIGVSAGVKGARISTGPSGTFFNAGANGIYYRKKLGSKRNTNLKYKKYNNNSRYTTDEDLAIKRDKNKNKGKLLIKYTLTVICLTGVAGLYICLKENANVKELFAISSIGMVKIFLGLVLDSIGFLKGKSSYIHFGRGEIATGLICSMNIVYNAFARVYPLSFLSAQTYKLVLLISFAVVALVVIASIILNRRHNSIDIVSNELDRMTYDVQFANRVPVVLTLIAYLILIGTNYAIATNDVVIFQYTLIALLTCAVLYFLFRVIGKVQLDYDLNVEQSTKWNNFVDNLTVLLDSKKIYAGCSSIRKTTSIYNHPIKVFKSLYPQETNISHSKTNVRCIELKANGIKCIFLPDRILATDYFNTESFYYADFILLDGEEKISTDESKLGEESSLDSYRHLYENSDGTRDKRRAYNPVYCVFKFDYIEFCDDNFWLKIASSKANIIKVILPNIKSYFEYAKENVNIEIEQNSQEECISDSLEELYKNINNKEYASNLEPNVNEETSIDEDSENNTQTPSILNDLINNVDNIVTNDTSAKEDEEDKDAQEKTDDKKEPKNKLLSDLLDNTNIED